jgi:hypothetical protein
LDSDENHEIFEKEEVMLLYIYSVWAIYLLLPVSILKNEVRMRPHQK